MEESQVTTSKSFPYKELALLVLGSVIVTSAALYVWHRVELAELRAANQVASDEVRKEIADLQAYRATLGTTTRN